MRLCAPDSQLGCLHWLETVLHQHLMRALDALMDHTEIVEGELTVVFYDLTTVCIHGEGKMDDDLRAFSMHKETGGIARLVRARRRADRRRSAAPAYRPSRQCG